MLVVAIEFTVVLHRIGSDECGAQKDEHGHFWFLIDAHGSSAAFDLTEAMANKVTAEADAGFQSTLQAFMDEQERASPTSVN